MLIAESKGSEKSRHRGSMEAYQKAKDRSPPKLYNKGFNWIRQVGGSVKTTGVSRRAVGIEGIERLTRSC